MIRRTFLKALCASPLGFLVKKPRRSSTEGPTILLCGEPTILASTYCKHVCPYYYCWCERPEHIPVEYRKTAKKIYVNQEAIGWYWYEHEVR